MRGSPIVGRLEAQTHLSRRVESIGNGVEQRIVIARNGKPAARLAPIDADCTNGVRLGLLEGKYPSSTQEAFDETNDQIARLFCGGA